MECYACSNEPTRQCRRCARVYCELHGGDLCAECLNPASSLPSFNLYRGSLLALLVGTAVALWLIVRPPGGGDPGEVVIANVTTTPIVTEVADTPTPALTATPATPPAETPEATPTEEPAPEPREYVVLEGDTLSSIAEATAPPGVDPFVYQQDIVNATPGLASIDDPIQPGDTLILP